MEILMKDLTLKNITKDYLQYSGSKVLLELCDCFEVVELDDHQVIWSDLVTSYINDIEPKNIYLLKL